MQTTLYDMMGEKVVINCGFIICINQTAAHLWLPSELGQPLSRSQSVQGVRALEGVRNMHEQLQN